MKNQGALLVGLFAFSTLAWAADETQKYLGLNEFRHVKPTVTELACGVNAWEPGNYFDNTDATRLFTPNEDTLTVKLKGAYFDYAPEASRWRLINKYEVQVGLFAEIAVKGGTLSAPGTTGIPGRLVFYSDNHFIGQRRIPDVNTNIYGPVMYTGGGLAVKLSTLEFDKEKGDQLKDTMLKSVAELGTKASAGVPAYLEGPLISLFQTALSAAKSRDDLFGQITFVLDDRNGEGNAPTAPLRTGDIVVVRQTMRAQPIDWDNLCYDPATAEVFTRVEHKPPVLNYVTISLLKNAGADAGRIQDALTYERLVAELQQRKSDAGLRASVTAITTALNERATDRELSRQIDILGKKAGSVTPLERSDAANLVSRVIYASLLTSNGFDYQTIQKLDDCTFLRDEKLKDEWLLKILTRLRGVKEAYTRESLEKLASPPPKTCVEANRGLRQLYELLKST